MAVASFYVLLEPGYADKGLTKLKTVKATRMVQNRPSPATTGMWIEINIEVPDAVFQKLVPQFNARMSEKAIEHMLLESSELHAKLVGEDDT
jgi:hypothetical protein